MRARAGTAEVVEAGDEVEVVAEAVGTETEPSRKDRDLRPRNLHHNPVAQASLVVA